MVDPGRKISAASVTRAKKGRRAGGPVSGAGNTLEADQPTKADKSDNDRKSPRRASVGLCDEKKRPKPRQGLRNPTAYRLEAY